MRFDWGRRPQDSDLCIDLAVPRREYHFFKKWKWEDISARWPTSQSGYTFSDQTQLLHSIQRFFKQPSRTVGDIVYVKESYSQTRNGFPGRMNCSNGCQGIVRAVRSNLLKNTLDIDMVNGQPCVVVFACLDLNAIKTPMFEQYVNNRDGDDGMLAIIMKECKVSKGKAKQLVIITLTYEKAIRTDSPYLLALDKEAKSIQNALFARKELQWIKRFCKKENDKGSFLSHVYCFVENRLLLTVKSMIEREYKMNIAALVFDGMNIYSDANTPPFEKQDMLDRAHAECERFAPGVNMRFAFKRLDFEVESKSKTVLKQEDGKPRELFVPMDFITPVKPGTEKTNEK